MPTIKPITAAGRKRVLAALDRHGMLLVQGQWELPSIADLLEGRPITAQGYSYDYVPAWQLREELIALPDYALCKLIRGRSTVVHRRLWPAVNALAQAAVATVRTGAGGEEPQRMLSLIEAHPGVSGAELKAALAYAGKEGRRTFQKVKGDLESWLCVWGEDQEESEEQGHTHDQRWYPWAMGKIGGGVQETLDPAGAVNALLAILPDRNPATKASVLLPAARFLRQLPGPTR